MFDLDITRFPISSFKWDSYLEERLESKKYLEGYGFKVYSQSDEDGIIEEIFNRIGVTNKIFIEFGVDYGLENNTHYLLLKNWEGLWIEGSEQKYNEILKKFNPVIFNNRLKVINSFITKENINDLISSTISGEIDLLSIDIDGNDIYVWDSINVINPRVVVIEYNGKLSPSVDWVQPYNPNFIWDSTDYSGASLNHINKVANDKGYQFVGTNVAGVNAFFVRKELCSSLFYDSNNIEDFYNPARYHLVSKPIGHPSFAYIGDRDNPELWYQNGKSLQFVDGFSYRETLSDGREFSWSNALKSTFLLLQNETGKYSLDVLIHLNNTKIKLKLPDETLEFVLNLGFNKLEFNILNTNIKWIKIEIILESLWSPMTSDTRELGIAIIA